MEEYAAMEFTPAPETKLREEDKKLLADGAKWAGFISIVMFVCIGLLIAVILFSMIAMGIAGFSMYDMYPNPYGPQAALTAPVTFWPLMIFCLILYTIQLIPTFYLYRFSRKTKDAILAGNDTVMTDSFRNLRGYFKVTGILLILGLIFGLLFGILMGIAVAMAV